eukprot:CFRG4508T1
MSLYNQLSNSSKNIQRLAAVSGALAIGLGAYGAHGLPNHDPKFKEMWATANKLHLAHSTVLLMVPLTRKPKLVGGLVTSGMTLFCTSVYVTAYTQDRTYGAVAPYGGFLMIFGWLAMIL